MTTLLESPLDGNISHAWLAAMRAAFRPTDQEVSGLVVHIASPDGQLREDADIRRILDQALRDIKTPCSVSTVASTIFPSSLWNRELPRSVLFERYRRIYPTVKRDRRNRNGTYFGRFVTHHDQLEHVLSTRVEHGNHRRSAYQLVVFDPSLDHGHWRQRGFPCLHQVSLVPDARAGTLALTAYYPTQTLFEKAYGNYVGLWQLGEFCASEWGLRLASICCVAAVAKLASTAANAHLAGEVLRKIISAS